MNNWEQIVDEYLTGTISSRYFNDYVDIDGEMRRHLSEQMRLVMDAHALNEIMDAPEPEPKKTENDLYLDRLGIDNE